MEESWPWTRGQVAYGLHINQAHKAPLQAHFKNITSILLAF